MRIKARIKRGARLFRPLFGRRGDTEHLLRVPANAAALRASIAEMEAGQVVPVSIAELRAGLRDEAGS